MTKDQSSRPWPGADERSVVEEMIRDSDSKHWENLNEFVKQRVHVQARNIPIDHHEEIIQETMYRVAKHLPNFRFRCTFRTWLILIIQNNIINVYRRLKNEWQYMISLGEASDEDEQADKKFPGCEEKSAEDTFMADEDYRNTREAMLEYADTHANSTRNRLIIQMVAFEGYSKAATAIAARCNPPVVGYVIREAKRYARMKLRDKS